MKIFLVGTELFQADGRTYTQTGRQAGRQMDVRADRRTDTHRHDEDNSRVSQFYEKSLKTDLI